MKPESIKFNNSLDILFAQELRDQANAIIHSKSVFYTILKCLNFAKAALLFLAYWICWYYLAFEQQDIKTSIFLVSAFALLSVVLGFTVGHDAGHGSFVKSSKLNDVIFWVIYNMIGLSGYIWKQTHNAIHHPYVNMPNLDIDVQENPVFRLGPHCLHRPHHRWQHFFAPVLYALFFFNKFFFNDFRCFKVIEQKYFKNKKHESWRFYELIGLKILYVFYMIIIPAIFSEHTFSTVLMTYLIFISSISIFFAFTLGGSHISTHTKFRKVSADGSVGVSYYHHQLSSTVDFYPESYLCSIIFGGLNSHVAHHLFPRLNSVYYPALTKIIKNLAHKHDLPYNSLSITSMWRDHFLFIRQMGINSPKGNRQLVEIRK